VTDRLQLLRELGNGAMGSVWLAHHLSLDAEVAVKFINRKLLGDEDDDVRERFHREAKAAARIRSPHIVQIFDHGVMQDGTPYIVMEVLEGESLADRLERTGWLSLEQCVRVVVQTASALSKAHKSGIVHRDIKPENIFLMSTDEGLFVKLLDFGIAKHGSVPVRSSLTIPGMIIGTAEYMSREQVVSAREVDHHADLWALSVTAYEVLTGDVPFTGETIGAIYASVVRGEYLPPSALRKGCERSVDPFFERAFASEPQERYASARELAVAFRDALGVDIPVRGASDPARDSYDVLLQPSGGTDIGIGDSREPFESGIDAAREDAPATEPPAGDPDETHPGPVASWPAQQPTDSQPTGEAPPDEGGTLRMAPPDDPPTTRRAWWAIPGAVALGVIVALVMGTGEPIRAAASIEVPVPRLPAAASEPEAPPNEPVVQPIPAEEPSEPRPRARAAARAPAPSSQQEPESEDHGEDPKRPDYGF
jgi:serine/threonine-protein kinase